MILHYLKVAIRNLLAHKTQTLVSLFGWLLLSLVCRWLLIGITTKEPMILSKRMRIVFIGYVTLVIIREVLKGHRLLGNYINI